MFVFISIGVYLNIKQCIYIYIYIHTYTHKSIDSDISLTEILDLKGYLTQGRILFSGIKSLTETYRIKGDPYAFVLEISPRTILVWES